MSAIKRRGFDDMSEEGDASSLPGASSLRHVDRTRADGPCPKTSCACPGEFHSSAPPAAPEAEQSCKAQKLSSAYAVASDMDAKEVDIARITSTVQVRPANSLLHALYPHHSQALC